MAASSKGHLEVVKKLIEAEANVNQANKVGMHMYNILSLQYMDILKFSLKHIAYVYIDLFTFCDGT